MPEPWLPVARLSARGVHRGVRSLLFSPARSRPPRKAQTNVQRIRTTLWEMLASRLLSPQRAVVLTSILASLLRFKQSDLVHRGSHEPTQCYQFLLDGRWCIQAAKLPDFLVYLCSSCLQSLVRRVGHLEVWIRFTSLQDARLRWFSGASPLGSFPCMRRIYRSVAPALYTGSADGAAVTRLTKMMPMVSGTLLSIVWAVWPQLHPQTPDPKPH